MEGVDSIAAQHFQETLRIRWGPHTQSHIEPSCFITDAMAVIVKPLAPIAMSNAILRVCPETSVRITKFSEHEPD
jgi:hypothetical protein